MHKSNAYLKRKVTDILSSVFIWRYLVLASGVLAAMLCVKELTINETVLDVRQQTVSCGTPTELAVMSDGSTVINDDSFRILCIKPDGLLKFHIDAKKNQKITGLALDENDNLYFYLSTQNARGITLTDFICQYDSAGTFVKRLFTIDYTAVDQKQTVRTSPLYAENGTLFFTRYQIYKAQLYRIELATGTVSVAEELESDIPFLYNDVAAYPDGTYRYAKITGELGTGTLGGTQQALYRSEYAVPEDTGVRPYYVRYTGGCTYVYDYWERKLYELRNGTLLKPEWHSLIPFNENVFELAVQPDAVMGISNGIPWYAKDSIVRQLQTRAKLPFLPFIKEAVLQLIKLIRMPLLIGALIYAQACILWLVLVQGRYVATKLVLYALTAFLCFIGIGFFAIYSEYGQYVRQHMDFLQKKAHLTAQIIDENTVSEIKNSSAAASENYAKLSRLLVDNYGLYEIESDTAALAVIPENANGNFGIIASNRGYADIFGRSLLVNRLLSGSTEPHGTLFMEERQLILAYSAVANPVQRAVGYVCLYTAIESIREQFFILWPPYMLAGYALLLASICAGAALLFTRKLRHTTSVIEQISGGKFNLRMPEKAKDEIGVLVRCVNNLSRNIESLIGEKTELMQEVTKSQYEVLESLASIVENKSGQTAAHVTRVSKCVRFLAAQLGYDGSELEYISIAAMLHDVGKLFVPPEILEKAGKLTEAEFAVVKRHTTDGEILLHNAPGPIMAYARVIAKQHHEHWDGGGYPEGIAGERIHIAARITAVADIFDALISRRSYKQPFPPQTVFEIMSAERGKQFDPRITDLFVRHFHDLCGIIADNPDDAGTASVL
ncbi:HD domain-containing phosphohydrolase [Treponema brennaborense]|uniref:Metal dependent phosphohydrolase n=1 Tax=Treponema brennaborense (strain DSM 12168 / CIP 105900 / DD5/3) TaxID=906968 RepID=F4LNI9_TREBD|nr:HD domain-containing phosphohydrolase [Treponema brennaborense]AEE15843.1 metal dependent phosphohydrolase [Treponema brennaborense DSM 12168]